MPPQLLKVLFGELSEAAILCQQCSSSAGFCSYQQLTPANLPWHLLATALDSLDAACLQKGLHLHATRLSRQQAYSSSLTKVSRVLLSDKRDVRATSKSARDALVTGAAPYSEPAVPSRLLLRSRTVLH